MILPPDVRALCRFPGRLPRGRLAVRTIRTVLKAMDLACAASPPIRRARRHLRLVQAAARS